MSASHPMSDDQYEDRDDPSISSVDKDLEDARKLLQAHFASLCQASLTIRPSGGVFSTTVYRLPEEVLYTMFVSLAEEEDADWSTGLGWMRVTHVCRYWRRVALRNPTLWWCLNLRLRKRWANTIVARSQGVPLEIMSIAVAAEEYHKYVGPMIRKTLHRATLLSIIVPYAHFGPLDDIFVCPAPLLECFELSYDQETLSLPFICHGSTPYPLPAAFLDHVNCPRLERLSLSGCTLPLGTHLDLSDLSLHNLSADHTLPFFELLSQLKALSLLIVHFHPSAILHGDEKKWVELGRVLKPLDVPHLDSFMLRGRNPECSAFMANIRAPHLCSFHVDCTITTGSHDEFREVLATMEGFIGHSGITAKDHACVSASISISTEDNTIDDFDVDNDYVCQIGVSSGLTLLTPGDRYTSSSAVTTDNRFSVHFSWLDEPVPSLLGFAAEICHATRLGDVHTLDVDLTENYMFHEEVISSIVPLVQTLKSLRSLSIEDSAGVDVDVAGMLRGSGFLRSPKDWTKVGNHWEVVRSAVPETFGEPGTLTTLTPIPRAPLPIDVDHWVPYPFPAE